MPHFLLLLIGVQQAGLLLFLSLAIAFHRKVRGVENARPTNWTGLLFVVYAIIFLITVGAPIAFLQERLPSIQATL